MYHIKGFFTIEVSIALVVCACMGVMISYAYTQAHHYAARTYALLRAVDEVNEYCAQVYGQGVATLVASQNVRAQVVSVTHEKIAPARIIFIEKVCGEVSCKGFAKIE